MRIELAVAPTSEPSTVDEAKAWAILSPTSPSSDDILLELIQDAREMVEDWLNLSIINRTYDIWLDAYEFVSRDAIVLPVQPISSVVSITTYNLSDDSAVFDATKYRLDAGSSRSPEIVLGYGNTWPSNVRERACMAVQVVAGYGADRDAVDAAGQRRLRRIVSATAGALWRRRGPAATSQATGLEENQFLTKEIESMVCSARKWAI